MSTISVQGLMEGLEEDYETGTLKVIGQLSDNSDDSSSFVVLTGRRISSSSSGSQAENVDRSIRKIYPKVRTGCDTCKRRKIKCDEGKPFCSRCVKSGRQCDGYHPPQIKLFEPLVRVDRSDTVNEERSFSYYLTETAVRMAGYRPIQLDEDFWSKLCPRMASSLPAVRSALVALGATSEKYEAKYLRKESADEVKQRTVFALEQYTRALRQLCASIGNSSISTEATLVCCLLLTSCDFWHTGIPITLDHSYAGLRICRTVQNSDYCQPPDDELEVDSFQLFPAFVHLADCATISGDHKDDEKASLVSQFANNTKLVAPLHFTDPHEAYAAMDRTMRQLAKITSPEFPEHVSNLQSYLPGLITALHESMALAKQQGDVMATFGFRSLVVHHHVANIILSMIGIKDEFMYDKYICDFEFIVSEIETLLQLESMDGKLLIERIRVWMGFIPPLFFAATKCRDSDIRHRAIKALHLAPHTERMWTTCTAAQVAQQILWLEETGIASEECINAACGPRINLLNIGFDLAQSKISLAYERQNVRGPKYATSTISWAKSGDVDAFYVPNWVEMPPKQVRVAGYAPIIMTFRGIRCHCGESTAAKEHSILLKSTMKFMDPQLSDASTITKSSGCSPG